MAHKHTSVIEKIRKLRAITEARGATEDEAIAAQQRMFTLLAKYNLELSEIPDDNSKPADPLESALRIRVRAMQAAR